MNLLYENHVSLLAWITSEACDLEYKQFVFTGPAKARINHTGGHGSPTLNHVLKLTCYSYLYLAEVRDLPEVVGRVMSKDYLVRPSR